MRTKALLLLMMGSALVAVAPAMPAAQAAGTGHATIANFSFSPNPMKIPVGTTLQWTNTDGTAHTVTADDNSFGSPSLAKNATFSHTFDQPGPVTYHCAIHPSMQGTVQVEASSTTAGPTTTTTAAPTTTTTRPATTTTTIASSPPTAGLASPATTAPKPAVSSTTRPTAAPTTSTTAAPTTSTTAPATTTTTVTEQTAPPAQAALDTPSGGERGNGGAVGLALAIAAVLGLGGGGLWAWRRRVSAG
jgi:plastocyanin